MLSTANLTYAYERWAKIYNLKQMAAALQFLQEHNLTEYDQLAARYSKKYLAKHKAELATYRAVRATMNDILNGAKLPKMDGLKKSRRELADKKKALYSEYRATQREMREAVAIKANIDHLLGLTDGREDKNRSDSEDDAEKRLWDKTSRSAGFGEVPQQAFSRPLGAVKISSVATL